MPTPQPFPTEGGENAKTAILLAFSALADDPRVRRIGDHLHARGWRVIGIGLSGAKSPPPVWKIHEVHPRSDAISPDLPAAAHAASEPQPRLRYVIRKLMLRPGDLTVIDKRRLLSLVWEPVRLARRMARVVVWVAGLAIAAIAAIAALGATLTRRSWRSRAWAFAATMASFKHGPPRVVDYVRLGLHAYSKGDAADQAFWRQFSNLPMREVALANGASGLWIANDWNTLSLAAEGVKRYGGAYVYDSHEFAVEEYAEHFYWRVFRRPLVATLERRYISDAKVVTTVSPGITAALKRLYALTQPCLTLRNMPHYREVEFRPSGNPLRILYQGVVWQGRGLEATIASVAKWKPEFELTIRGPDPESFAEGLRALAAQHGVADRVRFEPPVPASELVSAAAAFDVGLMALPGHSAHNAHALPNKIFEYMMAGLALCVSNLPAMRTVVSETGAGVLIARVTPEAIADAINALDATRIDAMKHRALEAAKMLHFDAEAEPVIALYEEVLARVQETMEAGRAAMPAPGFEAQHLVVQTKG